MEMYVPDMYKKSVFQIDFNILKLRGINCLLFDLDNTLVPYSEKKPSSKLIEFFTELKKMGFTIMIITNNGTRRVRPFKEALEIECYAHAFKPSPKKFLKIMGDHKFKETEIAIIGDQIVTDILGGNKLGITTVLVNPISNKDNLFVLVNRVREKRLVKKMSKQDLFYKGRYYD